MKFLIVGLGSMGVRRWRNLRHLGESEVIGFDSSAQRRAAAMAQGLPMVATLEEALARRPDAMIISTPPDRHGDFALAAARSGIHFFTEAGTSEDGLAEAHAVAARAGIVGAPSCTMRFHPAVKIVRDLVTRGRIGRVLTFTHHCGQYLPDWHPWEDYRSFYASRRETGACREIVPFELCWLTDIVGTLDAVAAMRDKVSDLDADIDDVFQLLLRTRSGSIGHLLVDVLARPGVRSLRLIGTTGTIEWTASQKCVRHYSAETPGWIDYPEPPAQIVKGYAEFSVESMYVEELAAFLAAVNGERPYPYSYADDHRNMRVLYAAERSSDEKRLIALEDER